MSMLRLGHNEVRICSQTSPTVKGEEEGFDCTSLECFEASH